MDTWFLFGYIVMEHAGLQCQLFYLVWQVVATQSWGGRVKLSWILGFVVIRRFKPHPSCMRRAKVRGYHQYKVVWDAQAGYNTMLSSCLSSCSIDVDGTDCAKDQEDRATSRYFRSS